ncbi:uncharacterized protein NECHADRAFT_77001 [Fusarium vanettenii 77-13-4]|uniref:Uncharacterized protein n=1 Tax=Fusarium vanettenii (strain ATCC MYA-4622 / CBS 123669 / FGSC 9596 / NRRL 45880 / 77-13-4) TaxID=660122 RepID=C7ZCC3_FUSV7|nr:uncharacterized protein NECHADRAFT_77001 [Fusarium vanettenii 77-13-4]EEU38235.1 predicted protein [Fusarium vanettenii 77-13-4]
MDVDSKPCFMADKRASDAENSQSRLAEEPGTREQMRLTDGLQGYEPSPTLSAVSAFRSKIKDRTDTELINARAVLDIVRLPSHGGPTAFFISLSVNSTKPSNNTKTTLLKIRSRPSWHTRHPTVIAPCPAGIVQQLSRVGHKPVVPDAGACMFYSRDRQTILHDNIRVITKPTFRHLARQGSVVGLSVKLRS